MALPSREFFMRDALEVAPNLLNSVISSRVDGELVSVRITEVEAYHGLGTGDIHDGGSHARMGKTDRNASMFGEPGHLYVYLIYGIYSNINVVCSPAGRASGVLLRAGEVIAGHDVALRRRERSKSPSDLASGPARLAMSLGLERRIHDGVDLLQESDTANATASIELPTTFLTADSADVSSGPRVGVSGEAGTTLFPWRFWLTGDPTVSKYRPGRNV